MTTMGAITIWHWWALGGALMMVELLAPGFFFLWLGAAAALVGLGLVAWPAMPPTVQLVLFAGLAFASMLAWRRFRLATGDGDDAGSLNRKTAQLIGQRASVLDPIRNGRGRVSLGDGSWTVVGPDLPAGSVVEITGAEGTLLHVRPV